jgi:hypothetical protein
VVPKNGDPGNNKKVFVAETVRKREKTEKSAHLKYFARPTVPQTARNRV